MEDGTKTDGHPGKIMAELHILQMFSFSGSKNRRYVAAVYSANKIFLNIPRTSVLNFQRSCSKQLWKNCLFLKKIIWRTFSLEEQCPTWKRSGIVCLRSSTPYLATAKPPISVPVPSALFQRSESYKRMKNHLSGSRAKAESARRTPQSSWPTWSPPLRRPRHQHEEAGQGIQRRRSREESLCDRIIKSGMKCLANKCRRRSNVDEMSWRRKISDQMSGDEML